MIFILYCDNGELYTLGHVITKQTATDKTLMLEKLSLFYNDLLSFDELYIALHLHWNGR